MKHTKAPRLIWVDQITSDTKTTATFYSDLLGFGQEAVEEPNASSITRPRIELKRLPLLIFLANPEASTPGDTP